MSKKRNTNKVRKALKRKRQQYHTGSNVTHRYAGRMGRWIPHNPATHGGGGGGQPNPNPNPNPNPDPDPDPNPPSTEPVDPRVGEVTVDRKDGQAPNVQIKRGETFTPTAATVNQVDATKEEDQLGLVQMEKATPITTKTITPATDRKSEV